MAVGSAPTVAKTIDEIVLLAYRKAGLIPLEFSIGGADWAQKAAHAYLHLNNIVDELAVHGFLARSTDFQDVDLTIGEQYYSLPVTVLNVFDDASYIPENNADTKDTTGETPVKPISRGRWQQLSTKSASGRPTYYYAHRVANQVEVRLWPQPDEAGTIRFQVHNFLRDNLDGNNNVDLERHWNSYLIYALAYELADDAQMPLDKKAELRVQRDTKLQYAKAYSTDNEGLDIVLAHRSPWT